MKKIFSNLLFVILCVLVFIVSVAAGFMLTFNIKSTAPYKYLKTDKKTYKVEYNLATDYAEAAKYDLYLPVNAEKKDYAMIMFIHGGGFTSGDKEDGKRICPYYASNGMIAISANYSLSTDKNQANINLMFEELKNTVLCAKKHCERLGYNITEMAATGESAGGCLALLLAYREPEMLSIPIKFVFVQSAPVNFDPVEWGLNESQDLADFVSNMSGKSFAIEDIGTDEYNAAIGEISPSEWVNADSVPTILAYGPRDIIVPPQIKHRLFDRLDEMNVIYQYIEFPNSGHGLLHDPDKSDEYYSLADEYIRQYFKNR